MPCLNDCVRVDLSETQCAVCEFDTGLSSSFGSPSLAPSLGVEEPLKRLQPCLFKFIKDKMLRGEEPTASTRKKAVTRFLSDTISSINSTMVSVSSHSSLSSILFSSPE